METATAAPAESRISPPGSTDSEATLQQNSFPAASADGSPNKDPDCKSSNGGDSPASASASDSGKQTVCFNCGTTQTPLWRRDNEGNSTCNACRLFERLHGHKRPLSMKRAVIKRRKRVQPNTAASAAHKTSTYAASHRPAPYVRPASSASVTASATPKTLETRQNSDAEATVLSSGTLPPTHAPAHHHQKTSAHNSPVMHRHPSGPYAGSSHSSTAETATPSPQLVQTAEPHPVEALRRRRAHIAADAERFRYLYSQALRELEDVDRALHAHAHEQQHQHHYSHQHQHHHYHHHHQQQPQHQAPQYPHAQYHRQPVQEPAIVYQQAQAQAQPPQPQRVSLPSPTHPDSPAAGSITLPSIGNLVAASASEYPGEKRAI